MLGLAGSSRYKAKHLATHQSSSRAVCHITALSCETCMHDGLQLATAELGPLCPSTARAGDHESGSDMPRGQPDFYTTDAGRSPGPLSAP